MSYIRMSHVTHMNESCHTYEWVMAHIWMGHVTHEWVIPHIWLSHVTHALLSHVTHIYESCHTCDWIMPHTWLSHVTWQGVRERVGYNYNKSHCNPRYAPLRHLIESCHRHVTHMWLNHVTHMWLNHVTHMTSRQFVWKLATKWNGWIDFVQLDDGVREILMTQFVIFWWYTL